MTMTPINSLSLQKLLSGWNDMIWRFESIFTISLSLEDISRKVDNFIGPNSLWVFYRKYNEFELIFINGCAEVIKWNFKNIVHIRI